MITIIKNWKLISLATLVITIVVLFLMLKSETHRANEAEHGRDAAVKLSKSWQQMTVVYKNKVGDLIHRTQVIELDAKNAKAVADSRELEWLKKFEGMNASKLQSANTFETSFISEEVPKKEIKIPCKDTLKAFSFDFKDQWNDIHAVVIDTPKLVIRDRYYGVIYLKRPKGWFWKFQWGKWTPVSEITNSNHLIKIDSIAVIQVKR